jgi:hypothetical protein
MQEQKPGRLKKKTITKNISLSFRELLNWLYSTAMIKTPKLCQENDMKMYATHVTLLADKIKS